MSRRLFQNNGCLLQIFGQTLLDTGYCQPDFGAESLLSKGIMARDSQICSQPRWRADNPHEEDLLEAIAVLPRSN
jgi:hypothetical protein